MRDTRGITLLGGTWTLPPLPSVKNNVKVTTFRIVIRSFRILIRSFGTVIRAVLK